MLQNYDIDTNDNGSISSNNFTHSSKTSTGSSTVPSLDGYDSNIGKLTKATTPTALFSLESLGQKSAVSKYSGEVEERANVSYIFKQHQNDSGSNDQNSSNRNSIETRVFEARASSSTINKTDCAPALPSLPKFPTRTSLATDAGNRNSFRREVEESERLDNTNTIKELETASENESFTVANAEHGSHHQYAILSRPSNESLVETSEIKKEKVNTYKDTGKEQKIENNNELILSSTHTKQAEGNNDKRDISIGAETTYLLTNSTIEAENPIISSYILSNNILPDFTNENIRTPSSKSVSSTHSSPNKNLPASKRITSNLSLLSSKLSESTSAQLKPTKQSNYSTSLNLSEPSIFGNSLNHIEVLHSQPSIDKESHVDEESYISNDATSQYSEEISQQTPSNDAILSTSNIVQTLSDCSGMNQKASTEEDTNIASPIHPSIPPRSERRPKSTVFLGTSSELLTTSENDIYIMPAAKNKSMDRIFTPTSLATTNISDAFYSATSNSASEAIQTSDNDINHNKVGTVATNSSPEIDNGYLSRPLPQVPGIESSLTRDNTITHHHSGIESSLLPSKDDQLDTDVISFVSSNNDINQTAISTTSIKKTTKKKTKSRKKIKSENAEFQSLDFGTLTQLLDVSKNSELGKEFSQLGMQREEKMALEKLVDSLSKLTTDMMLDPKRYEEGLRRLDKATRSLEGF
ncbi:hypothetical protein TBLA_0E02640 [Henningerozyma blattae CBS 6284]|uniref:Protein NBA1 n=1 Tax=Henningerozyma blattae (strain ATCC 34711 / CBS 6284 / DSM 70876 / NBRC 10599 / NRRL Y-10934 / UCD 77-7) TaxID=1071380 RepID=I2H4L8_HENB6|nr:hypothetical protein TBLA_0E02640 [Tetrapisispora blattae CBS 6284]CCH61320.1 hypothetical protein TBLA_0E02640 [Tetrapisispora blattae CBS 6284]